MGVASITGDLGECGRVAEGVRRPNAEGAAQLPTSEREAETALVKLVERHFKNPAILAGNTIHWDRRFIRRYWPQLEAKLHYRMLDVSSFKIIMQSRFSHYIKSKEVHRALDDIRESIAELKNYLEYFKRH